MTLVLGRPCGKDSAQRDSIALRGRSLTGHLLSAVRADSSVLQGPRLLCHVRVERSGIAMPSLCPAGHYCPPGASFITVIPCPAGTYGPKTGASSKSDCEACPPGMYCSSEGLHKPTGHCYAGYYCSQGAVIPTPITPRIPFDINFPQNDICPVGHYCPNGTRAPVPCPPGSFSMAAGLSSEEECQPCPSGHYCPQAGLSDPSMAPPCSAG
ncbi:sushi, von Willebrand factor type A, EGF and pentraxin domain-containing protein 1-like [Hyperolius riggenbachi]|uniref:sushi, von Willebrand factor type A, EGF and pentraxin domain-containing protein 1-like n=1 Tax=Hyperolius riggenbachi TaxID=752182 RepID=UPI0035A314F2